MESDTATPSTSSGSAECSRKTSAELEQIRTVSTTETGVVAGHHDSEAMASLAHTTSQQEMQTSIEAHTWRWPRTFAANMALVACACQMGVSWGHVNAYGTVASYYQETLLTSMTKIQMQPVGAMQCCTILFLSIFVGRFCDAGHVRAVLTTGTLVMFVGMSGLASLEFVERSFSKQYAIIIFFQGLFLPAGMSCFFVSSSQIALSWHSKYKSFAAGIVASGASVFGFLFSLTWRTLLDHFGDFPETTLCVGSIVVFLGIFAVVFSRPNPHHPVNSTQKWGWSTFVDTSAFRFAPFNWLTLGVAFMFLGFYALFFALEDWAHWKGVAYKGPRNMPPPDFKIGALQTWLLLGILNASSFIGRIGSAWSADHWCGPHGALYVHSATTMTTSLLVFVFWPTLASVAAAIAFAVIFGAFSGAVIGMPAASMACAIGKGNKDGQKKLGQWIGMMYCFAALPSLVGPLVAGALTASFLSSSGFLAMQMWCGTCLALASFCYFMATPHGSILQAMVSRKRHDDSAHVRIASVAVPADRQVTDEEEAKEQKPEARS